MGCHFLLQGIFPTQGLNQSLLHGRQILYNWATWEAQICITNVIRYKYRSISRTQLPMESINRREAQRKVKGGFFLPLHFSLLFFFFLPWVCIIAITQEVSLFLYYEQKHLGKEILKRITKTENWSSTFSIIEEWKQKRQQDKSG